MNGEPRGIEKLIQDAQKEGKFDDLEHKGQPLHVAFGDLASVANDVMRDNGIAPEWIVLSREIESLRHRQSELVESLERRRAADREELLCAIGIDDRRPTTDHREEAEPTDREFLAAQSPVPSRPPRRWSVVGRRWSSCLRRYLVGDSARREERRADPESILQRMEGDRRRALSQYAELLRTEARKVDRYNLVLSVGGRQMRRVRVEERLQEFQVRFPSLAFGGSPGDKEIHERVEPVPPTLLADPNDQSRRPQRAPEQVQALNRLRSGRRPPPIG